MKFLIAEDVELMRRLIIKHLNGFGYNDTVEAASGREALEKLRFTKVDFIITDWLMPNINGIELTRFLRAQKIYQNIPILVISSNDETDEVKRAIRAGISDYIVKPFTAEVLKSKIEFLIKKHGHPKVIDLSK